MADPALLLLLLASGPVLFFVGCGISTPCLWHITLAKTICEGEGGRAVIPPAVNIHIDVAIYGFGPLHLPVKGVANTQFQRAFSFQQRLLPCPAHKIHRLTDA